MIRCVILCVYDMECTYPVCSQFAYACTLLMERTWAMMSRSEVPSSVGRQTSMRKRNGETEDKEVVSKVSITTRSRRGGEEVPNEGPPSISS